MQFVKLDFSSILVELFSHIVPQFHLSTIAFPVHSVFVIVVIPVEVEHRTVDEDHHHEEFQSVVVL